MAKKKLRVGFDFDGVLVYNPLRTVRPFISLFKRVVLCKRKLKFYYPGTRVEKWMWALAHETSVFPAIGFRDLKAMIERDEIDAYVITARFAFLEESFYRWIKHHGVDRMFSGYYLNKDNEQPHKFKERMIKELKLDMFIDDNWDIVRYLNTKFTQKKRRGLKQCEIHWIYNIFDRDIPYKRKHPYLKKFLERYRR